MRLSVYVPDELAQEVRRALPGVNVSAALQGALRALLECNHNRLSCSSCAASIDRRRIASDALEAFYVDLLHELQRIIPAGTAEGAARVAKQVAIEAGVTRAETLPLPRATRAEREAAGQVSRLPMAHHPTTMHRRRSG